MSVSVGPVLEKSQEIEYLLRTRFDATGKGLNEYLDSIPGVLPADLVKKIRFIATIRNKLVHERGYRYDGDEDDFWTLCEKVISRLSDLDPATPAAVPKWQPAYSEPEPASPEPTYHAPLVQREPDARPWYRKTWFLIATFFLALPVWAILIVTDRNRGFFAKSVATVALFATAVAIATGYSLLTTTQTLGSSYTPAAVLRLATPVPARVENARQEALTPISPASAASAPTSAAPSSSTAVRSAVCTIEWQEYNGDGLAGKNRNQVWNGVVKGQVGGSGLTAAKFYALVVEQNLALKTDGYVFKKGKAYRLPKCK
jgi:hypothetical protein